ncbi:MAG: sugar kinase [Candidatus Hydrogenedentes bacterium]|nr:sugar kinase [Candidatus Hydrogenedentota bacterium]
MSITVVGSVALDTVETPAGRNDEGLGGAATYFSLAASNFAQVNLVGVVGDDFPDRHVALLESKGINLDGLERAPGRTFRWTGRYHENMNDRDTIETQLNVFEHFHPKLPDAAKDAPFLFLGNIHPSLQLEVLEQARPRFTGLDTMNLWINIALDDLKQVLKRVDVLIINDSEVKLLTGETNLVKGAREIKALGPRIIVVKKGEHGCLLFPESGAFSAPAYLLEEVVDPTGAGDTFAGGFLGHLAGTGKTDDATLRRAVVYGSVAASFTCEKFGPDRLAEITRADIDKRFAEFQRLASF